MNEHKKSFWTTPQGLTALLLITFPTYFLFIEHREHIFQFLPFLIILLCPLMHIFMHGNHGHHHSDQASPHDTFKEKTEKNEAYRNGYIEGLEEGRKNHSHEENQNAR